MTTPARKTTARTARTARKATPPAPQIPIVPATAKPAATGATVLDITKLIAAATIVNEVPAQVRSNPRAATNPFTDHVRESCEDGKFRQLPPVPANDKANLTRIYNLIHAAARKQGMRASVTKLPTAGETITFYYKGYRVPAETVEAAAK